MKKTLLCCVTGLLLAVVAGCSSTNKPSRRSGPAADLTNPATATTTLTATNQLNPELLRPGNAPFTLGPGDRVEIEILGTPTSRAATSVGPDGKLYCIPVTERPQVLYVWKDLYPNGFPTSEADFITQAAALKAKGHYAITFFGSTDLNGEAATRAYDDVLQSFGGAVDDGHGKMLLDTPNNIAAIQFLRDIVAKGYVPDIAFAGGFQDPQQRGLQL